MSVNMGNYPRNREEVEEECRKTTFFIRDADNKKVVGWIVEFASDRRGYGAIVAFPTGEEGFYGYDDHHEMVVYLGDPPVLPKFGAMAGVEHAVSRITAETVRTTHSVVIESTREDSVRSRVRPVVSVREPTKVISTRRSKPSERAAPLGLPQATLVIK